MLEANTFRTTMLVCGFMTLAILVACFFTTPLVQIDEQTRINYEKVMHEDLGDATYLTGYQALLFSIQGRTRGNVQHY